MTSSMYIKLFCYTLCLLNKTSVSESKTIIIWTQLHEKFLIQRIRIKLANQPKKLHISKRIMYSIRQYSFAYKVHSLAKQNK